MQKLCKILFGCRRNGNERKGICTHLLATAEIIELLPISEPLHWYKGYMDTTSYVEREPNLLLVGNCYLCFLQRSNLMESS